MLKKTFAYIWGKKILLAVLLLAVLLLPNCITRSMQAKNTLIITTLGIIQYSGGITVHCETAAENPGEKTAKYDIMTETGTNIADILKKIEKDSGKEISVRHCSAAIFNTAPDKQILDELAKTKIRGNIPVFIADTDIKEYISAMPKDRRYSRSVATIDELRISMY